MTVADLADELLEMIFAPSLTVSRELFASSSSTTFGKNDTVSSASILSVCKRWLRVATPLLYETIIIRSSGQSRALADVFHDHKDFAKHVNNLRVEGAYAFLTDIIPLCTNLKVFVIILNIYSGVNVTPLCKSLPLTNPTEVIIHDPIKTNASSRQAFMALCEAIPKWTNLTTFEYPYGLHQRDVPLDSESMKSKCDHLLDALAKSASLRTVHCPVVRLTSDAWKRLASRGSITFKIRYNSAKFPPYIPHDRVKTLVMTNSKVPISQIEFIDLSESFRPSQPKEPREIVHPFKQSSLEAVNDSVWSVIFHFATECFSSLDDAYVNNVPLRQANATRNHISLVCKRFERLVRPLIFHTPIILSMNSLKKFSARILDTPTLGQQVHVLYLGRVREDNINFDEHFETELCILLPYLTCLEHFDNRPATILNIRSNILPKTFAMLAKTTGKTLHTLNGLNFDSKFPPSAFASFESFQCLRNLDMPCLPHRLSLSFASQRPEIKSDALATLHTLMIPAHGWVFKAFHGLSLLGLKSVTFTYVSDNAVENFLRTSAPHVEYIKFRGVANLAEIFRLAPNLLHIQWQPESIRGKFSLAIEASLTQFAAHSILKVFTMDGVPRSGCGEKDHNSIVAALFNALNFANFPSLRDVHFTGYQWPTTERAISRDPLPKNALQVKQAYGVDINDCSGKPWRPRVQLKRR